MYPSIPACAGEPLCGAVRYALDHVYPRVCGGTTIAWTSNSGGTGLSPRVRGNPNDNHGGNASQRSIPACAGEPTNEERDYERCEVYPRVCGGTIYALPPSRRAPGLSPRVRGNRGVVVGSTRRGGSIPACAGEPLGGSTAFSLTSVYPRVCGGTLTCRTTPQIPAGLSPRVRGNHVRLVLWREWKRSIPACAGEPRKQELQPVQQAVYPRVCGGTVWRY